jgi:hypothetical protein
MAAKAPQRLGESEVEATPARPPLIVCIDHHRLGWWTVAVPGRHRLINANTLGNAREAASRCTHGAPFELIVRDAYNRVAFHEQVAGTKRGAWDSNPGRGERYAVHAS